MTDTDWEPTPGDLLPELDDRQQLAVLARLLYHAGWDDHLAGHITIRQDDGTLLCNPWFLRWDEFRPDQVIRIDLEGTVVEGSWPAPRGIPLHLAVHAAREDAAVIVHNHPRWCTVWSAAERPPAMYDQTSAMSNASVVMCDEYGGPVGDTANAVDVVALLGDADIGLLRNHGVVVTARSVRQAYLRCLVIETRCRVAWHVEARGGGRAVPADVAEAFGARAESHLFPGLWEAMARRELDADPRLLRR